MSVIDDLKRHEGFRQFPYRCTAGKLTIGYGINLDAGISEAEAAVILASRVESIRAKLSATLPFWKELSGPRQDILINMAYNIGIPGLLKFKQTLAYIAKQDYVAAADEMRSSKWASQVPGRATELIIAMRKG